MNRWESLALRADLDLPLTPEQENELILEEFLRVLKSLPVYIVESYGTTFAVLLTKALSSPTLSGVEVLKLGVITQVGAVLVGLTIEGAYIVLRAYRKKESLEELSNFVILPEIKTRNIILWHIFIGNAPNLILKKIEREWSN